MEGYGWKLYAGIVLMIGGFFNLIDGIVGVSNANYFRDVAGSASGHLPITDKIKTWSWVAIAIGAIMIAVALGVLAGATWARVLGIIAASANMIFQFGYLAHFPLWSFMMILIDVLVIYGLAAHGGRVDEYPVT